ncbi:uncharacterized protein PAC_04899 [Phialocephala subalpina]|uniref:Uncharacterized protein n=1 Tax=Phialocephala subalpina TaxID=576137 RepID=A0A1L7WQG2_9HELO|nr:uncharacterized protein PAC_04899 [Phialocephala subalpina]
MSSTDLKGRSELARKNTFQRMLDLEKKNKVRTAQKANMPPGSPVLDLGSHFPAQVNRMQASQNIPIMHTSTAPRRDSTSNRDFRDFRPQTLQATGRAMTTPTLSISIPTQMSSNGTSKKYVISHGGDLIPQEEEESEDDSDTSSICHSPGWDDISGKKKKKAKEQRRREKEKAEKQAKKAQKAMVKLSKAPPANSSKKLSRMSITIDRSNTEPVLPTVGDVSTPVEESRQPRASTSTRPRRGSLEAGLKGFISARNAIPVPWKTSHNISGQNSPSREFVPARTTSRATPGGFIGGLKLRQKEEAAAQETIRKVKAEGGLDAKGLLSTDTLLKSSTNLSSAASITESIRPISIYEESIRTPQQWDDLYSQAAQLARGRPPVDPADENVPIMERNIKKKKKHPPTSRYFPLESEDSNSSKRESSIASTRNSMTSGTPSGEDRNGQGQRPSSIISTDKPATGGRNASIDQQRGRSESYVGHQRKQSRDQSLAGFHEVQLSEANGEKRSESKSSFFRRSSRPRESSRDSPATVRPQTRDHDTSVDAHLKDVVITNPFLNDEYVVPQLHLGDFTASPLDEKPSGHRKTSSKSSHTFPGLNGIKSAFSKQPAEKLSGDKQLVVPPSPTGSFVSAVENQSAGRPELAQLSLTTSVLDAKTGPLLGESVPPTIIQDFALRPKSPKRSSPDTIRVRPSKENGASRNGLGISGPIMSNSNSSSTSHSRSTTDSSEDYSTLDEFSNITTPTISRPHSEKGSFPNSADNLHRTSRLRRKESRQDVNHNGLNEHPVMTGAIQLDDASSLRDSWCRTALPMDLSESEERMKTPTGKKAATDFTASRDDPLPRPSDGPPPRTSDGLSNSGIQRKPSLARSISTPDLQKEQDLSFLPALKHQALTKPTKKSRGFLGKKSKEKNKQASVSSDNEGNSPTSLVRPPPIPAPTTKSEGSSPTSSQPPSQYLQNARLNISGPRSPKTSFPHSGNPHLNVGSGPEPVAKMFVVCCSCKYFHDMPSKIYECMAKPDNVVTDTKLGVSGVISTSVKCPWCGHGMSTSCCAGYAAVVYLREKFH